MRVTIIIMIIWNTEEKYPDIPEARRDMTPKKGGRPRRLRKIKRRLSLFTSR
jgi:hypothetical protein